MGEGPDLSADAVRRREPLLGELLHVEPAGAERGGGLQRAQGGRGAHDRSPDSGSVACASSCVLT